jgi:ADP-dependent NAD(P)H-hydrate dehydratase
MFSTIKITKEGILRFYQPIAKETHKGIQGHVLLIGGSYGKIGSVCLSSKAALRSGCGLVTAYVPKCGYEIVQIAVPEAMVMTDVNDTIITVIPSDFIPDAIGIGMGMGQELETQKAFHDFLQTNKCPLIVDADALNMLSQNKDWISLLPKKTILTPHKKELERLIGVWKTDDEKVEKVIQLSTNNDIVIVVKGAPTLVVYKDAIYKNTTGNQALATAGSGDVLAGIITSLVAQNYEPLNAAILGVYLHGLTADLALPETGYESFIASDIVNYLGKAFLSLS